MTGIPKIVSFNATIESEKSAPDADNLIAGQPQTQVWNHYADSGNRFFAGFWAATRGSWRVRYTEHELCHLLTGRIVITSQDGERAEFAAGDSFVVPAGFVGTWEVLEDCRKLYAIFEDRA